MDILFSGNSNLNRWEKRVDDWDDWDDGDDWDD